MGELSNIIENRKWDVLVETGTGMGMAVIFAQKSRLFKKIYSFEINEKLYYISKALEDSKTEIYNMPSVEGLDFILPKISKKDKILFWLDAHYPGADFQLGAYDEEKDENIRLPLIEELKAIKKHRTGKDTVYIDDLRIYTEMSDERKPKGSTTIKDIKAVLDSTHTFDIIEKDELYGVFKPR